MRTAIFTVDMDRDVNFMSDGEVLSKDRGRGPAPRFTSSGTGAAILMDMFDDIGIKATFFAESVTLKETGMGGSFSKHEVASHGLEHEDISHIIQTFGRERAAAVLTEASDMIEDCSGRRPKGYRAPFMRSHPDLHEVLGSIGMEYSSSTYRELGTEVDPNLIGPITEIPVPRGYDRNGNRIAAYLWPMHEGKRIPTDYVEMADSSNDGIFVVATHTWHMVESIERGIMNKREVRANVRNVTEVIEGMIDLGYEFVTMDSISKE